MVFRPLLQVLQSAQLNHLLTHTLVSIGYVAWQKVLAGSHQAWRIVPPDVQLPVSSSDSYSTCPRNS